MIMVEYSEAFKSKMVQRMARPGGPSASKLFYYLYLVLDVYSRKIVAAQVHAEESMELSPESSTGLFRKRTSIRGNS